MAFAIAGSWPAVVAAAEPTAPAELPTPRPRMAPAPAWAAALLFALVGGALLNLMPCVFPVLSLKVLGFAAPRARPPARCVAGGLAYTAGVVLSFVALAALLLALRAGGEQTRLGLPAAVARRGRRAGGAVHADRR